MSHSTHARQLAGFTWAASKAPRLWSAASRVLTDGGPWARRAVAAVAGASTTLAHAPFYWTPFLIIGVVVLIGLLDAAARRSSPILAAASLGWWFGFGHFTSGLHWLASAFLYDFGAWSVVLGATAVVVLAAALACFWALGCAMAALLWTPDWRRVAIFAAALTLSEWLRGVAFTGFPWLLPGYVWIAGEPLSQAASVVGIYGLTALTLLFAASPAVLLDRQARASARFAWQASIVIAFALVWSWGALRLSDARALPPGQPVVRVADSGLSQEEKWRGAGDQEWRVLRRLLQESGASGEADIVIWPEGAIPAANFYPLENRPLLHAVAAAMDGRTLVAGLTRREIRSGEILNYNSGVVIGTPNGSPEVRQIYDKHRLVPFGEYIPFWRLVSGVNIAPLQRIGAGFEAGASPPMRLMVTDAPAATILICYEAIFPGLAPRGQARPGWIISLTNDAWFGDGAGPRQHFAIARYRAIETGLPIARAASGGVSAIIDAHGRVVASNRGGGFAQATLPSALPETLYSRLGLLTVAALVLMIALLRLIPTSWMLARR